MNTASKPMSFVLNYRPELLRQWLTDSTAAEAARVQLSPQQVRALAQDALAAHNFRAALLELVICMQLKDRADGLPDGAERRRLLDGHARRAPAAWNLAFNTLGIERTGT